MLNMWQVQRHLQLRIEAQGKYMQTILEKACQTLAGENMASGSYKGGTVNGGYQGVAEIKEFVTPLNFPSLQDLNIYGLGEQLELQQSMDKSSSLDGFMPNNNDNVCLAGKKGPTPASPYVGSGKGPAATALMCSSDHDLRLQELGTAAAASCLASQDQHDPFKSDHHQIQIASLSIVRSNVDIDSVSDNVYEKKPLITGSDAVVGDQKNTSSKLERPSPRRGALSSSDRMNRTISTAGAMSQGRNSPFG